MEFWETKVQTEKNFKENIVTYVFLLMTQKLLCHFLYFD